MPTIVDRPTLRQRLETNEFLLGMTCATMNPVVAEMVGYAGFDFAILDTEFLLINPTTLEDMVRAAECSGAIPVVKLRENNTVMEEDALVTGAQACMVPHVRTVEELRRARDAAYFHPKGSRGLCTVSRANRYGLGSMAELVEWTNREVLVIPIIEEVEAIERIDELMALEGVPLYELGPVDLSNAYRLQPDLGYSNPQVLRALERVLESARKHNKKVTTTPVFGGRQLTPELVKGELVDRGVRVIFYRSDSVMLRISMREACRLKQMF